MPDDSLSVVVLLYDHFSVANEAFYWNVCFVQGKTAQHYGCEMGQYPWWFLYDLI